MFVTFLFLLADPFFSLGLAGRPSNAIKNRWNSFLHRKVDDFDGALESSTVTPDEMVSDGLLPPSGQQTGSSQLGQALETPTTQFVRSEAGIDRQSPGQVPQTRGDGFMLPVNSVGSEDLELMLSSIPDAVLGINTDPEGVRIENFEKN